MFATVTPRGREREASALAEFLDREGPGLAIVSGRPGSGVSTLLASALTGRRAVHFRAPPLPPEELLGDLDEALRAALGELPAIRTPGLLPLSTPEAAWEARLTALVDRAGEEGEGGGGPLVLVLDGAEELFGAHRKWGAGLAAAVGLARERSAPLKVLLGARRADVALGALGPAVAEGGTDAPDLRVVLGPLPYRRAGWAHGARTPREAFVLWAVFGDHPAHLPRRGDSAPGERHVPDLLERQVLRRVLDPSGDLYDAPIRMLEATFRRPARYLALLRSLAEGPLAWSRVLGRTGGLESGGQLAPYLRRLEEEGLVLVERPVGSSEGARDRRYLLTDPFLAFWCALVLPIRSLLPAIGPERAWRERIVPRLDAHFERWLARASLRWLGSHASEALPAPARTVGGLWDAEAEFDAVAWLENGQVCYGLARWADAPGAGADLQREMTERMKRTRHGIGREARAPLYFVSDGADEALRRHAGRDRLARVLALPDLMGSGPPDP